MTVILQQLEDEGLDDLYIVVAFLCPEKILFLYDYDEGLVATVLEGLLASYELQHEVEEDDELVVGMSRTEHLDALWTDNMFLLDDDEHIIYEYDEQVFTLDEIHLLGHEDEVVELDEIDEHEDIILEVLDDYDVVYHELTKICALLDDEEVVEGLMDELVAIDDEMGHDIDEMVGMLLLVEAEDDDDLIDELEDEGCFM